MEEKKIALRSVNDLHGMRFFIPSYQRGYRWSEQQVVDLLNDVNEFDSAKDGKFYCLQPLVVHKNQTDADMLSEIKHAETINDVKKIISGKWNVIDGQQRLTTIFLILGVIGCGRFSLEYARESYIEKMGEINIDFDNEDDVKDYLKNVNNPDMYHLIWAKHHILKWWKGMGSPEKQDCFKNKILNHVDFIWYEIDDEDSEQDTNVVSEQKMFENLNSGKISLTNTELIKALFINSVKEDGLAKELRQSAIADEFDMMERALRKDDMWYFLAGNKRKDSSCLDLLFNLMLDSSNESDQYKDKEFRSFFFFKDLLKRTDFKYVWGNVRDTFHTLEGWFEDSTSFNLIGYLIAVGEPLKYILREYYMYENKPDFVKLLKTKCNNTIGDNYREYRFDNNKNEVRKVLLLFNVAVLLEDSNNKARFSFESYHKNKWDVEHISPQHPNIDHAQLLVDLTKEDKIGKSFVNEYPILQDLVKALQNNDEEAINKQLDKFFAIKDDDVMALSNLTLLSEHDNRGIGNNFFFVKRDKLKEYYQNGSYIPIGSLNVFSKFYSSNPKQPLYWDMEDAEDYLKKIEETIENFKQKTL